MKWSALVGVLLAIGLSATAGAQAGQDVWVSPPRSVATGMAPGMKVELLSAKDNQKTYAVIFSKGDEAFSGLADFARQYHVTAAHFTAIGALESARLAWFDPTRKMYKQISIDSQVEVLSMIGDIALYNGKPAVHTHMVVGFPDGSTRGGHVLEAHVRPTLEVMVTVEPNAMHRRLDPETDLSLIDPAAHE
ncbi:MAG: PPC domain-containing DNA-binding protein [Terracidiphilus sp.]|jgi:predicted DNA-binding protein with PD1-like motif